jgi:cell division protein FtsI (penicillin-binding protein 3)
MSGVVFHNIAEGVMAQNVKMRVEDARDSTSTLIPDVKNGNLLAADYVLNQLDVKTQGGWSGTYSQGNPIWGKATREAGQVVLTKQAEQDRTMPDVNGMGARDVVYMLERLGLKVSIAGTGRVVSQSMKAGQSFKPGDVCYLELK